MATAQEQTAEAEMVGWIEEAVVTLIPGADPAQLGEDIGATFLEVEEDWCARYAPIPPETAPYLVARLTADPRVVTAEQNGFLESAESRQQSFSFDDGLGSPQTYGAQAALGTLGLETAHQISRGAGVRIAVLDTGIDLAHPEFAGRIVAAWDFVDNDVDPSDSGDGVDNDGDGSTDEAVGHGTHVAGIVRLVAPEAELLVARVLDGDGRGDMLSVAAGVRWAQENGARVINLSLGSLRSSDAVQYALETAENAGISVVVAAGNWGGEVPVEYPAKSSHAIAVAAIDDAGRAAPFTSFGDYVALSAPGVSIRSTFVGGGYRLWSGTSMAAPFVSGAAALLHAIHPGWGPHLVVERLGQQARDLDSLNPGLHEKLGEGGLDIAAALELDRFSGQEPSLGDEIPIRRP